MIFPAVERSLKETLETELGRYLNEIDWSLFHNLETCEQKNAFFHDIISNGFNLIMPERKVKFHTNDAPWITEEFKQLIKSRQRAFSSGNSQLFKFYRNKVNRERKLLRAKFFATKVSNLWKTKPKAWWSNIKRISGMKTSNTDLQSQLQIENTDHLSSSELANLINGTFLEPMNIHHPLRNEDLFTLHQQIPPDPPSVVKAISSPASVLEKLKKLNPSKAPGPDGIPNWILKTYAEILAFPISNLLNSSYQEGKLPTVWKEANITPIPKEKPISDINKHLRPISLTSAVSKLAEDFIVEKHIAPAILSIVDPAHFGGVPRSSTTHALISMVHKWSEATDGTGNVVRAVLFDYRKAFDLIDHHVLARKVMLLSVPSFVKKWILDFLSNRRQRVKLSNDCFSEWGRVPSGVPQGTKLGPWLFILMINDLKTPGTDCWKYIDDTTISEVICKGSMSSIQHSVDVVQNWSITNKLQLNDSKCKEIRFCFTRSNHTLPYDSVVVNGNQLEVVTHARILGLTVSSDLKWNKHILNTIKKANKRFYFIVQLKRAKVPTADLLNFYCTCIRQILEYCCQVYHYGLPSYLSNALERVQKRVMSIIYPNLSYDHSLALSGLAKLGCRREEACKKLFKEIVNTPDHKLAHLLPPKHETKYNLRQSRDYIDFTANTNRFSRTFFPSCVNAFKNSKPLIH